MRSGVQHQWHLDEVFVKVNGETHYLWRAVDHEGEVLESYVTKARDRVSALKFLKKTMKRHGRPEVIVTDRLRSYGAALKDLGREPAPSGLRTAVSSRSWQNPWMPPVNQRIKGPASGLMGPEPRPL